MAEFYAVQIRLGTIAIGDVPERFREDVRARLIKAGFAVREG